MPDGQLCSCAAGQAQRRLIAEQHAANSAAAEAWRKSAEHKLERLIPPAYARYTNVDALMEWGKHPQRQNAAATTMQWLTSGRARGRAGLYLYGLPGRGKTMLLYTVVAEMVRAGEEFLFWKYRALISTIQSGYSSEEIDSQSYIDQAKFAPVLLLDDIGNHTEEKEKSNRIDILEQIIDYRAEYDLPVIATSNYRPAELTGHIGRRPAERLIALCALVEVGGPNLRVEGGN